MPGTHELYSNKKNELVERQYDHSNQTVDKILGRAIFVEKIYKVIDDGGKIELLLESEYLGEAITHRLPRRNLARRYLMELADFGFDVSDFNVSRYAESIQMQEGKAKVENVHKFPGWGTAKNAKTGQEVSIYKAYSAVGVKSAYIGGLDIEPRGTMDGFPQFYDDNIKDTPLVVAMLMGLTAVTVGFIGSDVSCTNLVYHLYGNSTTGKTTAASLAVSMAGNPELGENSLMRSYDATENHLHKSLVGNTGVPIAFDEASLFPSKDFGRFVYRIASGLEKGRLTRDGELKSLGKYSTASLSTGEKSLSDDSSQNAGREVRVQQFGNIQWTRDALHAEAVMTYIRENYGHAVYALAEHILDIGKAGVLERHRAHRKVFIERSLVKNSFTERVSVAYAMMLVTLEMASAALDIDLPYDYVLNMLLENEVEGAGSKNLSMKAYDYLIQMANTNADKFSLAVTRTEMVDVRGEIWGIRVPFKTPKIIGARECSKIVCFSKQAFHTLLGKKGFEDISVVIKQLKADDLLDHEAGRDTRTRKISTSGDPVEVYALRVFDTPEDDLGCYEPDLWVPNGKQRSFPKRG
jgi:hypothetical protein